MSTEADIVERVAQAIVLRRGLPPGALINWDSFRADSKAALQEAAQVIEDRYGEMHPGCLLLRRALSESATPYDPVIATDGKDAT